MGDDLFGNQDAGINTGSPMLQCPNCQGTADQLKAGRNPSGSQRYKCKPCSRKYTPEPNPNGYSSDLRRQAVMMNFKWKTAGMPDIVGEIQQITSDILKDYQSLPLDAIADRALERLERHVRQLEK
jgi:hypothetical protein